MQLLQENADLLRAKNLLQVSKNYTRTNQNKYCANFFSFKYFNLQAKLDADGAPKPKREDLLRTENSIFEAKISDLEAILNGQDVDLTLVEEKKQLQQLNVGLAEKIATMKEKEGTILAKLQDAKDQSELLEFRVLELEEEQEKVKWEKELFKEV